MPERIDIEDLLDAPRMRMFRQLGAHVRGRVERDALRDAHGQEDGD